MPQTTGTAPVVEPMSKFLYEKWGPIFRMSISFDESTNKENPWLRQERKKEKQATLYINSFILNRWSQGQ